MVPDSAVFASGANERGDPPNPRLVDPGLCRGLAAPQSANFGSSREFTPPQQVRAPPACLPDLTVMPELGCFLPPPRNLPPRKVNRSKVKKEIGFVSPLLFLACVGGGGLDWVLRSLKPHGRTSSRRGHGVGLLGHGVRPVCVGLRGHGVRPVYVDLTPDYVDMDYDESALGYMDTGCDHFTLTTWTCCYEGLSQNWRIQSLAV